jgi:hypothetical protein
MLGGEIMETMISALASTYKNNIKFIDGLSCKSSIEKKKSPMGVGDGIPLQEYKM